MFTWKWEDDEDWVNVESVITVEFQSHGSETELHLTQVGFPVPASRDRHGIGWGVCFNKLDCRPRRRLGVPGSLVISLSWIKPNAGPASRDRPITKGHMSTYACICTAEIEA